MGNQYGPYVMYFLSQLLQKQSAEDTENATEMSERTDSDKTEKNGEECNGEEYEERKTEQGLTLSELFAYDETESSWHRETKTELLRQFCLEGYASAKKYGHFIIGCSQEGNYIGIPGRFLLEEQPAEGKTGFTLWQPIKGGEEFFDTLETIDDAMADSIYGYWIAALDEKTLQISEV